MSLIAAVEGLAVPGCKRKVKSRAGPSTATDACASVFAQDDMIFEEVRKITG